MKNWLKDLGVTVLYAVFIAFLIIWLAYTVFILKNDPGLANAYVAIGTLILAIVTALLVGFTWLNIKNSSEREKRDRKERLLNEIIEWVTEIQTISLDINIPVTGKPFTQLEAKRIEANVLLRYGIPFSKNEYIRAIVCETFKEELQNDVENTINAFTTFFILRVLWF